MAETEKTAAMQLDALAALDLPQRREVAKALRKVAALLAVAAVAAGAIRTARRDAGCCGAGTRPASSCVLANYDEIPPSVGNGHPAEVNDSLPRQPEIVSEVLAVFPRSGFAHLAADRERGFDRGAVPVAQVVPRVIFRHRLDAPRQQRKHRQVVRRRNPLRVALTQPVQDRRKEPSHRPSTSTP